MNQPNEQITVEELQAKINELETRLCCVAECLDDVIYLVSSLADDEFDRAELRRAAEAASGIRADLGGKP